MFRNILARKNTMATSLRTSALFNCNLTGSTQKPGAKTEESNDDPANISDFNKRLEKLLEKNAIEEEMRQEGNYGYWVGFSDEQIEEYQKHKNKNKYKIG